MNVHMQPPRTIAVATYLLFGLAGVFFMFWSPNIALKALLGDIGFILWNVFLMLGGAVGALGAGYRQFRIEIIASPFLWSGLWVYGGSLIPRIFESTQPGVLAGLAAMFFGAGLGFLGQGIAIYVNKIRIAGELDGRTSDGS